MFDHLRVFIRVLLVPFALLCMSFAQNGPSAGNPPYLDTSKPINVRVDDLVSRMTLEEKASQVVNQARAIPRLQVPAYDWWSEALHGVANAGTATVFPEPIGLAATFDPALIHEMAIVIGTEARAKHNQAVRAGRRDIMEGLDFWSPNINIFRDPRWGGAGETKHVHFTLDARDLSEVNEKGDRIVPEGAFDVSVAEASPERTSPQRKLTSWYEASKSCRNNFRHGSADNSIQEP